MTGSKNINISHRKHGNYFAPFRAIITFTLNVPYLLSTTKNFPIEDFATGPRVGILDLVLVLDILDLVLNFDLDILNLVLVFIGIAVAFQTTQVGDAC